MSELKSYAVWDVNTRWFHWINVICVTALAVVGVVILNAGDLGVHNAGKVTLKTVHAWIGYVFVLNLLWRIAWAFFGNCNARWRSILPGGRGYFQALRRNASAHDSSSNYWPGAGGYRSVLSAYRALDRTMGGCARRGS